MNKEKLAYKLAEESGFDFDTISKAHIDKNSVKSGCNRLNRKSNKRTERLRN